LSTDFHIQKTRPREGRDARIIFPLNGAWEIEPGLRHSPSAGWRHSIQVPSLVDVAMPSYDHRVHEYHWYRLTFTVPHTMRRETALLVLDQAMFGTSVWLNDRYVGEDIACYTSQEYDVTHFLHYGTENVLLVRVGSRATLPPESAVGRDQERDVFIPGIWGDVALVLTGSPRCSGVQVIPHIDSAEVEIRVSVLGHAASGHEVSVGTCVFEKESGRLVTGDIESPVALKVTGETVITFRHLVRDMQLWSPGHPFLYEAETIIRASGHVVDRTATTFGMREFTIRDGHFHLNGARIFLRGGNIAFHRFLSDPNRARLPWDPEWIKRVLIDLPKAHNFNFFRNHLGQMYNRWYDIADEHGMLLQNEWQFWMATGTEEQITREFTRWLRDNWNHPSIVIWDALNESTDAVVEQRVIPRMKELDPTRPWEPVDLTDDHPYIYSLGPVLHDQHFGFSRSLQDLAASKTPAVVNEFLWWWLDRNGHPTKLTGGVIQRWLGEGATAEELDAHQCFLGSELVELFRRMRLDAVQPFVYLSNDQGPTANWFLGPIQDLTPRPLLSVLRNAFAPVGVSLEIWDRHFTPGEHRKIMLHVMNDEPVPFSGEVTYGVRDGSGAWITFDRTSVAVGPSGHLVQALAFALPEISGRYEFAAALTGGENSPATTRKVTFVLPVPDVPSALRRGRIGVLDLRGEVRAYLSHREVPLIAPEQLEETQPGLLVVVEHTVRDASFISHLPIITRFVRRGGCLILLEPEAGVADRATFSVLEDMDLRVVRRVDADKGGYDSYVFPEDIRHALWEGIEPEHLRMFNGAYGGEAVSQHDITAPAGPRVLARCGLQLQVPVVMEWRSGEGRIIVSRLQVRGRLMGDLNPEGIYARRKDPVSERYLLNLLAWAMRPKRETL
jgi:beta-galactosidase